MGELPDTVARESIVGNGQPEFLVRGGPGALARRVVHPPNPPRTAAEVQAEVQSYGSAAVVVMGDVPLRRVPTLFSSAMPV